MDKRGKLILFSIIVMILLIIFSFYFVIASNGSNDWVIEGNKVYVNDSKVYISAAPHTIQESGYVYFNISSKVYEGDVDVVFGFDTDKIKPIKAELYKPEWKIRTHSYTCPTDYFNYTLEPKHFWCYKNIINNQTDESELILIKEGDFESGNLAEKTVYWTESYLQEWKDYSHTFSSVNYDYEGMNKWYYVKNIPIEKNKNYYFRNLIKIPRGNGFSPMKIDTKYWFAIKPSSETIQQAINNEHLYALDPWINSTGEDVNKNYLDNNLTSYYKFDEATGNTAVDSVSGVYNTTAVAGLWGVGKIGNSSRYTADNNNRFIVDPGTQTYTTMTIAMWMNATGPNMALFDLGVGSSTLWVGGTGRLHCFFKNTAETESSAANEVESSTVVGNGNWYHVACAYNGTAILTYVNGVSENNGVSPNTFSGTLKQPTTWMFGGKIANNYPLNGNIDEAGIWNRTLNSTEILDLYNSGLGITYTPISADTTPPETTIPIITPTQPKTTDNLQCNATLTDNMQTSLIANWTWYKNNISYLSGNTSVTNGTNSLITNLNYGNTSKNEQWICEVTPYDGINYGNPVNSSFVTILNSAPTHTNPLLSTPSGKNLSTENLTCYNQSTYDADNDVVTNIYNWYKNNQPLFVLNMPFETNADDYSGYGNDGTIWEASKTTGRVGNALNFDGVDDYIFILDENSLDFVNTKTWQLWFKRNSFGAETLFDKGDGTNSNYKLEFLSNNLLKFSYSIVPGWISSLWELKTKANFDEGNYEQTYYNTTHNAVMLNDSYNGNYTSKIFNDSEKTLSFNTLSWSADVPAGEELSVEENMVGLWHLNENSGNITYDETTNNNDGIIYGAGWITGKFNSALDFDGNDDYVSIDSSLGDELDITSDITVTAWIKWKGPSDPPDIYYPRIIEKDYQTSYMFSLRPDDATRLSVWLNNGERASTETGSLSMNEWHHVGFTFDDTSNAIKVYIDGEEKGSGSYTGTITGDANDVFIGRYPESTVAYFNGTIDEVVIYNRTLNFSEILENHNKGIEAITNLSFSVRSCANNDCSDKASSWDITEITSSPTNISSLTNNKYFQFKAELSTNNTDYSPKLYNISLNYSKQITEQEVNITSTSTITDTNWHLVTVTFNETGANNLKLYINDTLEASKIETNLPYYTDNNLTIAKFFNGSIDEFRMYNEALTSEQIQAHYNLEYNKIVSEETSGGDVYMCQITPNDGEEDGEAKDSNNLTVLHAITFNVTYGEDGSQESNFNIDCDNGFSVSGINSPYTAGFGLGNYVCVFSKNLRFDRTVIFTADDDKTVNITLSKEGQLTVEEHTWLEAIYNCLYQGDCSLYNLLLEINQTVGNIWEHTKPTDESVVTFENITNKVVNSTNNLTIDYTVSIPIKAGYVSGTYLPVRIGFWFLDENNETCYNQGDKPTGVEDPYCQPLIIETIGPMGGSVSFTVEMQPSLPAGNYNIKRIIDIDPQGTWTNYGQDTLGIITMSETLSDSGIALEKTGETMPGSGSTPSSSGGSGGRGSSPITNIYNTYVTGEEENKKNSEAGEKEQGEAEVSEEEVSGSSWITGGVIGAQLLSGGQITFILVVLCGTFIVFMIVRYKTSIKLKKNLK